MKTTNLDGIEITRLHHSSFKIKAQGLSIYLDPHNVADEPADLILITHEHFDHFDKSSITKLQNKKTKIIVPSYLSRQVSGNIISMKVGDTFEDLGLKIIACPSYNISRSYHPKERGDLSYLLEIQGKRIYFSGDSDNIPEMSQLKDIDVAMLPIGGTYTMDEEEAAAAVSVIKPQIVIPMHFGLIAGGGDPESFKNKVGESSQVQILE